MTGRLPCGDAIRSCVPCLNITQRKSLPAFRHETMSTGEIRRLIMSLIPQGETEIQSVARALGTSARSLQRRLSAAGTSYHDLLDSTRCEAATRYLQDRRLSIGEVAYLLGYSEPPAFHRAFKRWNGITPQEFRAKRAER